MSLSSIPLILRNAVRQRDRDRCRYCGLQQAGQASVFHIDHILARSRGGATALDNLVQQCPSCSLRKSNKTHGMDPVSGEQLALFHPLQQTWAMHFVIRDDGTCEGLTPTGRATVDALRMNDPLPRTARAVQRMMKLL